MTAEITHAHVGNEFEIYRIVQNRLFDSDFDRMIKILPESGAPPMSRKAAAKTNASTATIGFEAKLWLAADKLRNNMDAAEYSRAERDRSPKATRRVGAEVPINHVVLGLIFLKYISDTFEEHRTKLLASQGEYAGANAEDPDEYKAENVFWVPAEARWSHLQGAAKLPTIGKTVDDAMVAIERDLEMSNPEARMWN